MIAAQAPENHKGGQDLTWTWPEPDLNQPEPIHKIH